MKNLQPYRKGAKRPADLGQRLRDFRNDFAKSQRGNDEEMEKRGWKVERTDGKEGKKKKRAGKGEREKRKREKEEGEGGAAAGEEVGGSKEKGAEEMEPKKKKSKKSRKTADE